MKSFPGGIVQRVISRAGTFIARDSRGRGDNKKGKKNPTERTREGTHQAEKQRDETGCTRRKEEKKEWQGELFLRERRVFSSGRAHV